MTPALSREYYRLFLSTSRGRAIKTSSLVRLSFPRSYTASRQYRTYLEPVPLMPAPVAETRDDDVGSRITLDAVVADPHLHAMYLQYLSTTDKKDFARLLFLVSVEEFKKVLASNDNKHLVTRTHEFEDPQASRRQYASKIIAKFLSPDAFLDIASENLCILNKSVASFGTLLRNDLMLYAGLAAKTDLFHDAEVAVKKALQPSFRHFATTSEFAALVASSQLTYVGLDGVDMNFDDAALLSPQQVEEEKSPGSLSDEGGVAALMSSTMHTPTGHFRVRRQHTATTFLTLERVLGNRRLCSVFWVFLFKERTHQYLSLWMDFRYQLLPVLEAFIHAAQVDIENEDGKQQDEDQLTDTDTEQAGALIEQLLAGGSRIAAKYLTASASTRVTFVGETEQALLRDYELCVACCLAAGTFSLADAVALLGTVERIQAVIEADLKVNHFVRFMGSESFKSLVASYQSRLLSPSGSANVVTSAACDDSSTASDSSMTTLQELFQCMNVASHQPQRVRSKSFTLRGLLQGQHRGESQSKSLISSVMSFRLDVNDRSHPEIIKEVLHTLADPNKHSERSDLYHYHAIPDHVEAFFQPSGADVVRSTTRPKPSLFHMTIGNADKAFYGACLTRYVPLNDMNKLGPLEQVLQETEGLEVYVPAGICIISRYPILDTLKQRLDLLHTTMQDDEAYLSDVNWLPSAAQMAGLLCPFEFAAATSSLDDARSLSALDSYVDFSMEELFSCLSIDHVVALVTCMLLERQIVLVSSHYSVLTSVGETLKSLIAPLEWSHVFAPILPKSMLECLQCPTPYLFGVHASYRVELHDMLEREGCDDGIVVVDLDADTISSPVRPQLPESILGPLTSRLLQLLKPKVYFSDYVPMVTSKTDALIAQCFPQGHVRLCFREAVAALLHKVEEFRFVLSDDFDYVVVFDRIAFLRSLPPCEQSLYRCFLETQVFSHEIASVGI